MLETGSTVPDLAIEGPDGRPARLGDLYGDTNVLLYFMRSTTCAVCNSHVKDLVARAAEFDSAGVQVVVVVPEGRSEADAWRARRSVPYPVVTGGAGSTHQAVGLTRKVFGAMQQSGSLLIDRRGVVRHAHAATMPTGAYDRKGIARAIHDLPRP